MDSLRPWHDVYDHIALHVIAKTHDAALHNVYTLALHVMSNDIYTIPREVQWCEFDAFLATTVILDANTYRSLAAGVEQHAALELGGQTVHYTAASLVEGFQPYSFLDLDFRDAPPIPRSCWSRRRISEDKTLGDLVLNASNIVEICKQLKIMNTLRWAGPNLEMNPQRLGDFDEIWPSPVWIVRHDDDLHLADPYGVLAGRDITFRVNRWCDGMLTSTSVFFGPGPHRVPRGHDVVEQELIVDGLLMDKTLAKCVKQINMAIGGQAGLRSFTMARHKRKGIAIALSARTVSTVKIGSSRASSTARSLSNRWREQHSTSSDRRVEHIYNPLVPDAVKLAFRNLSSLANGLATHIIAVDPFALDPEALEAVVAIAASAPRNLTLEIVTKFQKTVKQDEASLDARIARFRASVEYVAREFEIYIRVFHAVGLSLHDRFLFVDERVWHVGPSFNALGEELGAAVEMNDMRAIAELRSIVEGFMLHDPVIESNFKDA